MAKKSKPSAASTEQPDQDHGTAAPVDLAEIPAAEDVEPGPPPEGVDAGPEIDLVPGRAVTPPAAVVIGTAAPASMETDALEREIEALGDPFSRRRLAHEAWAWLKERREALVDELDRAIGAAWSVRIEAEQACQHELERLRLLRRELEARGKAAGG